MGRDSQPHSVPWSQLAGESPGLARSRLVPVGVCVAGFTALALPISTAATSVGKALVLLLGIAVLFLRPGAAQELRLPSVGVALTLIGLLAASMLWTIADLPSALNDLAKYAKLLLIPALIVLLPTRRDALLVLGCFAAAQTFVIASSIVLGLGLELPWITNSNRISEASVFSDYITQSVMTATFGALSWVLRGTVPGRWGRAVAVSVAVVALFNTLYFLPGRTGWVVAASLTTLIVWWELPRRFRAAALLTPLCLAAVLLVTSGTARNRFNQVIVETGSFLEHGVETSSSGERLSFWRRSAQSIAEHPVLGTGVGSWQARYHLLEGGTPPANTRAIRNPHNEYLLIGVQVGLGGVLLFVALLLALCRDGLRFERPAARAVVLLTVSLAVASLFNSALFDSVKGNFFCIVGGLLFAYGAGGDEDFRRAAFAKD